MVSGPLIISAPATLAAASTKAAVSAAAGDSAPEATGRCRLIGCCASAARSSTSFTRYTAPESPQKIQKVAAAAGHAVRSSSRPLKSRPAKTKRFFVHCCGRTDLRRSSPGLLGNSKATHRVRLVVVAFEDGEELRD